MDIAQYITHLFNESIDTKLRAAKTLAAPIAKAADQMIHCLLKKQKIMSCGNGGSAADAQHFSAELLNRFEMDRMGLPAIALTTDSSTLTSISNDYDFKYIFSKQVSALGTPGDLLLALSTSGNSENILLAIQAAQQKDCSVIALTGHQGGQIRQQLSKKDIEICVPSDNTPRIQETHLLIIHCLCDIIEQTLFNNGKKETALSKHARFHDSVQAI